MDSTRTEPAFQPSYLELARRGELSRRAGQAVEQMIACRTCAWECGVNRLFGETGRCQTGLRAWISSYGPHLGEEDPLRGWRGSGTIFFNRCNLKCAYCQNYEINHFAEGFEVTPQHLAGIMLGLQKDGCHNINLVSPSHVVPQILSALVIAVEYGLNLPLVYNTGGYDSLETLHLLDGIIDIYLPDMKYSDPANGLLYSGVPNYPRINQAAVLEMHRQVGELYINELGIATSGLLVRHLVLPNQLAGTREILHFLAEEVSRNTYINLMDQYQPYYQADQYPELNRPILSEEYQQVVEWAHAEGLNRLDHRNRLL